MNEANKNERFCIVTTFLDDGHASSCDAMADGAGRSHGCSDNSHTVNANGNNIADVPMHRVPSKTSRRGGAYSSPLPYTSPRGSRVSQPPAAVTVAVSPRQGAPAAALLARKRVRPHLEARANRAAAAEALRSLDPQLQMKILAVAEPGQGHGFATASAEHARRVMGALFLHSYDGKPQVKRQVLSRDEVHGGGSGSRPLRSGTKTRGDMHDDDMGPSSQHPHDSGEGDPTGSSAAGSRSFSRGLSHGDGDAE